MLRPIFTITALCALLLPPSIKADEAEAEFFKKSYKRGKNYYGFCMFCHGRDGKGTRLDAGGTMAPPLAGSPRVLGPKEVSAVGFVCTELRAMATLTSPLRQRPVT